MKKIFFIFVGLSLIYFLAGCFLSDKELVLNKSKFSNEINEEIFEYFNTNSIDDDEWKNEESIAPIDLWRVNKYYTVVNDYLINLFDDSEDYMICGYLNLNVKDVLDKIQVDKTKQYSWSGINYYLKKYEYALENNLIEKNLNLITWYECEEQNIIDIYNDAFLLCVVKIINVEIVDIKNDTQEETVIFVDINGKYNNTILYDNLLMNNYLLLLDNEILREKLTVSYLLKKIRYESFNYIVYENNKYICPNCGRAFIMTPKQRFDLLFDDNSWERLTPPSISDDPLNFEDRLSYKDRLQDARSESGCYDAVTSADGTIGGLEYEDGIYLTHTDKAEETDTYWNEDMLETLSKYFDVDVTSFHSDNCEYVGVWICYKD